MQPDPFAVEAERRGELVLLKLSGELDLDSVSSLEQAIGSNGGDQGVQAVAIDLRGLDFIDSSGLRALLKARADLAERGVRVAIIRGRGQVGEVFEATGIGKSVQLLDDPSDLRLDSL